MQRATQEFRPTPQPGLLSTCRQPPATRFARYRLSVGQMAGVTLAADGNRIFVVHMSFLVSTLVSALAMSARAMNPILSSRPECVRAPLASAPPNSIGTMSRYRLLRINVCGMPDSRIGASEGCSAGQHRTPAATEQLRAPACRWHPVTTIVVTRASFARGGRYWRRGSCTVNACHCCRSKGHVPPAKTAPEARRRPARDWRNVPSGACG